MLARGRRATETRHPNALGYEFPDQQRQEAKSNLLGLPPKGVGKIKWKALMGRNTNVGLERRREILLALAHLPVDGQEDSGAAKHRLHPAENNEPMD